MVRKLSGLQFPLFHKRKRGKKTGDHRKKENQIESDAYIDYYSSTDFSLSTKRSNLMYIVLRNVGGVTKLSLKLNIKPSTVSSWKTEPPAKHCLKIEELSKISRYDLRPDIFGRDKYYGFHSDTPEDDFYVIYDSVSGMEHWKT